VFSDGSLQDLGTGSMKTSGLGLTVDVKNVYDDFETDTAECETT
jgi:hypothetical protein